MGKFAKLLLQVMGGRADANIAFSDARQLLLRLGFAERIRGGHHVFFREDVEEILNLQPKDAMAKPYQVKQIRNVILRYGMGVDDEQ